MKTIIFVQYEPETAKLVCNFPDAFAELPLAVQLDVITELRQNMKDTAAGISHLIARASADKNLGL